MSSDDLNTNIEQQQIDAHKDNEALQDLLDACSAEVLQQAISELPSSMQSIVVLFYFQGMSQQTIAQVLDVGVRTVEAHLYRARYKLRHQLADHANY